MNDASRKLKYFAWIIHKQVLVISLKINRILERDEKRMSLVIELLMANYFLQEY